MKYLDARSLQCFRTNRWTARRSGYEFDALLNDKINNVGALHIRQRNVHAEGFSGEVPHFAHLGLDGVEFPRSSFDDTHSSSITDRRRELRSCNPAHGCLNDGIVNSQHLGDSVVHSGGSHALSSFSY